jgi:hypothetical protein
MDIKKECANMIGNAVHGLIKKGDMQKRNDILTII